ncbi:hypothetical protein MTBBW1_20056 [Desulfamplus magnetovallimortis]|uniref:Uncharacterized protein n=1 Tax=Desulfamplus magnetovallimortis TaxID=1246637 RepID=A0A1W1HBP4_9BACT|nr:hypothetical protein MTBBW1_20056 [Desulfamplus magnetovallimortis]
MKVWIRPYALLTPHKAGWLTRQIKSKITTTEIPAVIFKKERPGLSALKLNTVRLFFFIFAFFLL